MPDLDLPLLPLSTHADPTDTTARRLLIIYTGGTVGMAFNRAGEPIVCTPRDAVESFCTTPLDALAIGSFLLEKPTLLTGGNA